MADLVESERSSFSGSSEMGMEHIYSHQQYGALQDNIETSQHKKHDCIVWKPFGCQISREQ